jgi:hypothetical protein
MISLWTVVASSPKRFSESFLWYQRPRMDWVFVGICAWQISLIDAYLEVVFSIHGLSLFWHPLVLTWPLFLQSKTWGLLSGLWEFWVVATVSNLLSSLHHCDFRIVNKSLLLPIYLPSLKISKLSYKNKRNYLDLY